ncbi:hypothetical protein DDA93_00280 [Arthrobacter sp. Bz4]|nr:hypothetical protein DDA93_00280 [Arthrobacter sp. Bz4]
MQQELWKSLTQKLHQISAQATKGPHHRIEAAQGPQQPTRQLVFHDWQRQRLQAEPPQGLLLELDTAAAPTCDS